MRRENFWLYVAWAVYIGNLLFWLVWVLQHR